MKRNFIPSEERASIQPTKKDDVWIPLADGTRPAAYIWLPEDAQSEPVPAILEYLPYRRRDGTAERNALIHTYFARGDWRVRIDTQVAMGVTRETFPIQAGVDAFEGGERVFTRNWSQELPRDLV